MTLRKSDELLGEFKKASAEKNAAQKNLLKLCEQLAEAQDRYSSASAALQRIGLALEEANMPPKWQNK